MSHNPIREALEKAGGKSIPKPPVAPSANLPIAAEAERIAALKRQQSAKSTPRPALSPAPPRKAYRQIIPPKR